MSQEMGGNPRIDEMGIAQDNGAMEGKEIRLGSAATALWSITTTVTSNGSVNGMHDSTMPLSGMMEMLNMTDQSTWFGGVGVGWMNYFYIYYYRRVHQWVDGRPYTGVPWS